MTSAAFSCDIARSTRGSTMSPTRTEERPAARARIFSTAVSPTSDLDCAGDDGGRPLVLRLDALLRQELLLEGPVFGQADEVGKFAEARDELGSPFQEPARRGL